MCEYLSKLLLNEINIKDFILPVYNVLLVYYSFFFLYILPIYSVLPAQFSLPITILQCFVNLVFLPIEPVYSVLLTYYYLLLHCYTMFTELDSAVQCFTGFYSVYSIVL